MIADINPLASRQLPLKRVALVTIDFVRASRGLSREQAWRGMEQGNPFWVWNITVKPNKLRELRFLADELCQPDAYRRATLDSVVTGILGNSRRAWRISDVSLMLMTSHCLVYELVSADQLELVSERGRKMISRESLAAFLKQRRIV